MALKVRIPGSTGGHPWSSLLLRVVLLGMVAAGIAFFALFGYYYIKYQHIVDDRLKEPLFADTAKIYAAPREVRPGQKLSVRLISSELREAGYSTEGAEQTSELGTFSEGAQSITVQPGPQSYHAQDPATIRVGGGVVRVDHRRAWGGAGQL